MLEEFWAITKTSLYHVRARDGSSFSPAAVKVALRGSSQLPVGAKLEGGTMIAVCKFLLAFFPERYGLSNPLTGPDEREPAKVNTRYWGARTSDIIALFLKKEGAEICSAQRDLQPCDPRWIEHTKAVLRAIGDDHPTFVISHFEDMALIPEVVGPY